MGEQFVSETSHQFLETGTRWQKALWRRHPRRQAGCQGTGRFVSPIPDVACSRINRIGNVTLMAHWDVSNTDSML